VNAVQSASWFNPAGHIADLLLLLKEPARFQDLSLDRWDVLVRTARRLRLLAMVAARLRDCGHLEAVPGPVRAHLASALATMAFRRQKVLLEMDCIRQALVDFQQPVILLKGAAYIEQGLALAGQRLVGDLDLLVAKAHLDEVEARLLGTGWESLKPDPYDQKYYRAWSHELPPMQLPGHRLELDVHHNILPPTGRLHPDAGRLIENAFKPPGSPFHVLHPADQVLQAVVHLFQDSDCVLRARDLVDIDALIRTFAVNPDFWDEIIDHAGRHGVARPLWYALDAASEIMGTPVPVSVQQNLQGEVPALFIRRTMRLLLPKALFTEHPERPPSIDEQIARSLLFLRSFWLRMPFALLLRHSIAKMVRHMRKEASAAQ
jgi:hypothetical protein